MEMALTWLRLRILNNGSRYVMWSRSWYSVKFILLGKQLVWGVISVATGWLNPPP